MWVEGIQNAISDQLNSQKLETNKDTHLSRFPDLDSHDEQQVFLFFFFFSFFFFSFSSFFFFFFLFFFLFSSFPSIFLSRSPLSHISPPPHQKKKTQPNKKKKKQVLRILHNVEGNKECGDCGSALPDWASINLGILLCLECSGVHRSLGVHVSKVFFFSFLLFFFSSSLS